MNEKRAREILGASIKADNRLEELGEYVAWAPGNCNIVLDGHFDPDTLEAIAWWVKNMGENK